MKYCPFCGAELLGADISFCAECGKQLPAGAAPQTEPGTPPVAPDPQRDKSKKASFARQKRNPRKKNKPVIEPHQAEPVINQSVEDTAQDPAFADEYSKCPMCCFSVLYRAFWADFFPYRPFICYLQPPDVTQYHPV